MSIFWFQETGAGTGECSRIRRRQPPAAAPTAARTLSHPLDLFLGDKAAQGSCQRQAYGSGLGRPPTARDCAGRIMFSKPVEEVEGEHQLFSRTHPRKGSSLSRHVCYKLVTWSAFIESVSRTPTCILQSTHYRINSWCFWCWDCSADSHISSSWSNTHPLRVEPFSLMRTLQSLKIAL